MGLVAITTLGFKCDVCAHEWLTESRADVLPTVCPYCSSTDWNSGKKVAMTYEEFRDKIASVLDNYGTQTWTEVRTRAALPQLFPNNVWVRRMEKDIGLNRKKSPDGRINWSLGRS